MTVITYTAVDRGDLVAGHSALTEYSFEVPLLSFNSADNRSQTTVTALSGKTFTTLKHIKKTHAIQTRPIKDEDLEAQVREFLSSVAAGEEFLLDPFGKLLEVDEPLTCKRSGNYSRTISQGKYYSFSFGVEQV